MSRKKYFLMHPLREAIAKIGTCCTDFYIKSPGFKARYILYDKVISKGDHKFLMLATFFFTELLCVDDPKSTMMWTSLMGDSLLSRWTIVSNCNCNAISAI